MEVQRTVTILLPDDPDLRRTLSTFTDVQQAVSAACFADGTPLGARALQRLVYHQVKGRLSSQMTISALRLVAGAYASTVHNRVRRLRREAARQARCLRKGWAYKERAIKPLAVCQFTRPAALFLVGRRGRDADFRADGTLAIWTVAGRKRLPYTIPASLRPLFTAAQEIDSVTVIERNGRLYGRVVLTLDVPEPAGTSPVGIDLNETNALVAVDAAGRELFVTGLAVKVANRRTAHTVSRLQTRKATRKAAGQDTRSVRRACKRLSRRRAHRTRDFARCTAKRLVAWAPADAVLVFEDLSSLGAPERGLKKGPALRRRLALWQHGAIRQAVASKAEMAGIRIVAVDPAYTSQTCNRCGRRGIRKRHAFTCPACSHTAHADLNAARNIRDRFVQVLLDGEPSISPEARSSETGKPSLLSVG